MAQTAASATNVTKMTKEDRKKAREARGPKFSQKARYIGPTKRLTLSLREADDGGFTVQVVIEKKDPGKNDSKNRGMVTEHKTKDEALKKYDEVAAQCVAGGWTLQSTVRKSAFDAVPKAD